MSLIHRLLIGATGFSLFTPLIAAADELASLPGCQMSIRLMGGVNQVDR